MESNEELKNDGGRANYAERFEAAYILSLERWEFYKQAGIYAPFITEELKPRAKATYCENAVLLSDTMEQSGATPDLIHAVTEDYATLLCGLCEPNATPKQMYEALRAVKPIQTFFIDRYSVYFGLFQHYRRFLAVLQDYVKKVHNESATPQTKESFIKNHWGLLTTPSDAKGVSWLIETGFMVLDDWIGVTETADLSKWVDFNRELGGVWDYCLFYLIAKNVYRATPEELEQVEKPPYKTQVSILTVAENNAKKITDALQNAAKEYGKIAEEEATKAEQEQAKEAAKEWQDKTNEPVQLSDTVNIICSRPVEISPNGEEIINTLSVQRYIAAFSKDNPKFGLITTSTVQMIFEALNAMRKFPHKMVDGRYKFNVSRTKLSELCGYKDANQEQKLALVGALLVLSHHYIVVDRPLKFITYEVNGRKRTRKSGGKTAVQVIIVPEFEVENEGIEILVAPEIFKGRPTLITVDMFQKLREEAKGLTHSRFSYQILTKGHKAENDLLNEIFGYDEKLQLTETPEDYKEVKNYIRKHVSDDKKKLAKWFEMAQKDGIITYQYKEGKEGYVYSWIRTKPPRPEEYPKELEDGK